MNATTTPINGIKCASSLVDAFDDAVGGSDPVVDRIADMAKASLAALVAAASVSREVSLLERGRTVDLTFGASD